MAKKLNRAELAKKYAKALLQEAIEHKDADNIAQEVQLISRLMSDSSEMNMLMTSRLVNLYDRKKGVELVAEHIKLSQIMRHFLGVLIENGRTFIFNEITAAFIRMYEEYKGILSVSVVSAQILNDQTQQRLTDTLKAIFNKEIRLNVKVNPALIGGLTVQAGSLMADASVKTKLQKLNLIMKGVGI
ncbi:MAG: ATP synthase F1 subunit delta [Alphaproteobacteria bacterium]|nr:ATP synthase F1 subunit delta [Alphaproteobacteria bacterium]